MVADKASKTPLIDFGFLIPWIIITPANTDNNTPRSLFNENISLKMMTSKMKTQTNRNFEIVPVIEASMKFDDLKLRRF